MEHGAHHGDLVLAVAVTMRKNLRRGMRLPATNAKLDGNIADIALHEGGDGPHLVQDRRPRGGEFSNLLLHLGSRVTTLAGQLGVPAPDFRPIRKALVVMGWRKECQDDLPGNRPS